jgi:signal transduction histidine kinase
MHFTTRTKITFLFTIIVIAIIALLDMIIFRGADHAWQEKKKDYAQKVMQAMYTPEQAKKELTHVEIRDASGAIIHRQWVFLASDLTPVSTGFLSLGDDTITVSGASYILASEQKWDITLTTAEDVTSEISMRDDTIHTALWTSLFSILFVAIIGYLFSGYILRPIRAMQGIAESFSLGKKSETHHTGIVWHTRDEVVLLARSLESLFSRVQGEAMKLEQFSDDIAHEIKNKLFSIESSLDVALHTEHRNLGITKAKKMMGELSSIVDALLFFSRGGEGDMTKVNITELIRGHADLSDSRISIIWDDSIEHGIYPELFMTAIGNIISNAQKFTPLDGHITITILKSGIDIRDTWVGIAERDLPRIFDRLWKWDSSRTSGSGYGLGLAITKKIIEDLHHMKLSVESIEGEGTIFRIEW